MVVNVVGEVETVCHEVNPEGILAYVLHKRHEVSFKELKSIKFHLEKKEPSYFVDLSYESLSSAAVKFPEMFVLHNGAITRAKNAERYFNDDYIKKFFKVFIPNQIFDALELPDTTEIMSNV